MPDTYTPTTESLAQEIRTVDGAHSLGASSLAEALMPWLAAHDAEVAAKALAGIAIEIRDALDEWEASGDDERMVNEVLDPLVARLSSGGEG